jgi:hypothetical protein
MTEERKIVYDSYSVVHRRIAQFVQKDIGKCIKFLILWNVLDERTVLVSISSIPSTKGERDKRHVSISINRKRTKESGVSITQADKAL